MTDFRALCTELLSAMDTLYKQSVTTPHFQTIEIDGMRHAIPIGNDILAQDVVYADLMARARAALDQPEPEAPTDTDLFELMPKSMRNKFFYVAEVCSGASGGLVPPGAFREALNTAALEYAQAVLAKYGGK